MSNRKFLTDVPWTREQLRRLMSGKRVALEYKPFKTLVTDITRLVLRLPTTRAVERLESILQALGQMEETHYDVLVVPCAADCEAILSGARKGAPRTYQQVIKQALDRVRQELATGKVDEKTLTNDSLLLESCIEDCSDFEHWLARRLGEGESTAARSLAKRAAFVPASRSGRCRAVFV